MLLTPRYGEQPVLSVEVRSSAPHPVLAQRRRLEEVLRDLTEGEWHHPSRCAGWSVQDVVTHLTSTNGFWALSIQAGLAGEPTRFLSTFDPVASPAQLVDREQGTPVAETLERFVAGNDALAAAVAQVDGAGWEVLAEAPPGHVPIRLVADHALWDAWIHERDIVLPLGRPAAVDPDEVLTCLRYSVGLGRAFQVCQSSSPSPAGSMAVEVQDPHDRIVVEAGADHVRVHADAPPGGSRELCCDAVSLVELLAMRDVGPEAPPDGLGWLTSGLATAFDQPSAGPT